MHIGKNPVSRFICLIPDEPRDFRWLQDRSNAHERPKILFGHPDIVLRINEEVVAIQVLGQNFLMRERKRPCILRRQANQHFHIFTEVFRGVRHDDHRQVYFHAPIRLKHLLQERNILVPVTGNHEEYARLAAGHRILKVHMAWIDRGGPTTRAGTPATVLNGGTSRVTTAFAPTIAWWPMVTPFSTTELTPSQQLCSMITGALRNSSLKVVFFPASSTMWSESVMKTLGAIRT